MENVGLQAHEYTHFSQQAEMGFGGFYLGIVDGWINYGFYGAYFEPGTFEYSARQIQNKAAGR